MTRRDTLQCVHEPFGDAFYYGPERLGERYENDEKGRAESGFAESTYKTIFDRVARENEVGSLSSVDICRVLFPVSSHTSMEVSSDQSRFPSALPSLIRSPRLSRVSLSTPMD
jgi:hypothetical protein